jgi:uncharacterized surface protein with fasciclin (FAS1) repeats
MPSPFDIPTALVASRTVDAFVTWLFASEMATVVATPHGPFTVFVPTNLAVDALPDTLSNCLVENGGGEALWTLMSYHVVEGSLLSKDMEDGMILETFGGETLSIKRSNGAVLLNTAGTITVADFLAANGVIHVISEVLIPPSTSLLELETLCLSSLPTGLDPIAVPADSSPQSVQVLGFPLLATVTIMLIAFDP